METNQPIWVTRKALTKGPVQYTKYTPISLGRVKVFIGGKFEVFTKNEYFFDERDAIKDTLRKIKARKISLERQIDNLELTESEWAEVLEEMKASK